MALILPIPTPPSSALGESFYKLIQLSKIVNTSREQEIVLDYSKTIFQHSAFLTGLHILIKEWQNQGKNVSVTKFNNRIDWYLKTVSFPNGMNLMTGEDLSEYYDKTFTPLVVFSTEETQREKCIEAVLRIIFNQTNIRGKDSKNTVSYFISELTNNVADHSDAVGGVIFVQTYYNLGFIDISIADNGIGVFRSYEKTDKYKPRPLSEADSIEMAINGNSTKDMPESRGFGLSSSLNLLINGLNGKFGLWTGGNMFICTEKIKSIIAVENGAFFKGCFVTLRLPIDVSLKGNFYDYVG